MIIESKYLLISSNEKNKGINWGYLNLNNIIEVETETTTKRGLVTGIITPLDMVSIAL